MGEPVAMMNVEVLASVSAAALLPSAAAGRGGFKIVTNLTTFAALPIAERSGLPDSILLTEQGLLDRRWRFLHLERREVGTAYHGGDVA